MPIIRSTLFGTTALVMSLAALDPSAEACTRILWNDNKLAVIAGRTMDFPVTTEPILTVLPRGTARDGGLFGGVRVDSENPARWTSKYGSIVTSVYGAGTGDGVNEKGVAMHLLYLVVADFGPRDPKKAGVQAALWGQYVLDNAATVEEAYRCWKASSRSWSITKASKPPFTSRSKTQPATVPSLNMSLAR